MADAKTVMELREKTGAGVMDCKAALQAERDLARRRVLRKKGLSDAKSGAPRRQGRPSPAYTIPAASSAC